MTKEQMEKKIKDLEEIIEHWDETHIDKESYIENEREWHEENECLQDQLKTMPKKICNEIRDDLTENLYSFYSCPITIWEKYGDTFGDVVVETMNKTIYQIQAKFERDGKNEI